MATKLLGLLVSLAVLASAASSRAHSARQDEPAWQDARCNGGDCLLQAAGRRLQARPSLSVGARLEAVFQSRGDDDFVETDDDLAVQFPSPPLRPPNRTDIVRALLDFKALFKPPAKYLDSWREGSDPCIMFERVKCKDGYVVALDLSSPEDVHSMYPETAAFSGKPLKLSRLHLPQLPCQEGFLTHVGASLQRLKLDNMRLDDGTLPGCWSSMRRLRELSLSMAGLSGPLPIHWSAMTSLQHLDLSDNPALTGTLPAEWAKLKRLSTLDLSLTLSREPRSGLGGPLPRAWRHMRSLQVLDLWRTNVSGTLPSDWAELRSLNVLYLSNTSVSGPLPASWAGLANLTALYLTATGMSGSLPAVWGRRMEALRYMELSDTALQGELPRAWQHFCRRSDVQVVLPWTNAYGERLHLNSSDALLNGVDKARANLCRPPNPALPVLAAGAAALLLCAAVLWWGGARLRRAVVLGLGAGPPAVRRIASATRLRALEVTGGLGFTRSKDLERKDSGIEVQHLAAYMKEAQKGGVFERI